MRKRSSRRLIAKFCFLALFSLTGLRAQQPMPDNGFEQFRKDLAEIESTEKKLQQYMEASLRFSQRMPDSVFALAEEIKNLPGLNTRKQDAYFQFILANAWGSLDKDSVIYHATLASEKMRELGDHASYLNMENLLGLELSRQKEYVQADSIFKNAIAYSQTLEEVEYPVKYLFGNLGSLYSLVGAHDLAINMYERFLQMEDSPGNRCNIVSKLAMSLSELSEYPRAIRLLSPCLEVTQLPPPIQSVVRSNLSRMYERNGDKARSMQLMKEAVKISTIHGIPNLQITQLIELGNKYLQSKELNKADSVRILIEKLTVGRVNPQFLVDKNIFFADMELAQNEYHQAVLYATQAIEIAEKNRLHHLLRHVYSIRSAAFENLGELKNAVDDLRRNEELEKTRRNLDAKDKMAMMSVRYQLQNKEAELVNITDELQTVKLRDALIFLFLIVSALFLLYKFRIHFLLQEVNTRNRIARDLHDDLSGTLSSISFFSEAAKRVQHTADASRRYLQLIDKSAIEAKEKINDIIWAIDPANDDWSVFLNKCKRFAADAFDSKEMEYEIHIGENFTAANSLELRQNLWLIFKEMVTNLVKHSAAEKVKINFLQQDKIIRLEVEDDGMGFDVEEISSRYGIKNIRHRAEQIGAEVILESTPEKGTSWKLTLKA